MIRSKATKNGVKSPRPKGHLTTWGRPNPMSTFRAFIQPVQCAHPWTHLAALFALHVVGIFLVKGFIDAGHPERLAPLLTLFLGLVFCLWALWRYRDSEAPHWVCAIPALLYAFFISALSHQPLQGVRLPVSGNVFHPVVYGCMAVYLGWFRLSVLRNRGLMPFILWIILPGTVLALSDEWHQSWIPGRCSSATDVLLDLIGLGIGTAITLQLTRRAPQWNPHHAVPLRQEPIKLRVTARRP